MRALYLYLTKFLSTLKWLRTLICCWVCQLFNLQQLLPLLLLVFVVSSWESLLSLAGQEVDHSKAHHRDCCHVALNAEAKLLIQRGSHQWAYCTPCTVAAVKDSAQLAVRKLEIAGRPVLVCHENHFYHIWNDEGSHEDSRDEKAKAHDDQVLLQEDRSC